MRGEVIFKDHQAKIKEQAVPVRMDDGQLFILLPPALWPDEVLRNSVDDPITAAEGMLEGGHDAYAEYKAAGGNAMTLVDLFQTQFGESLPESPASSSS